MGLPKAYQAVQANGGQMALESEPGRGTTVRLTFPVAKPAQG
jgi:signal transduction histidine kinase